MVTFKQAYDLLMVGHKVTRKGWDDPDTYLGFYNTDLIVEGEVMHAFIYMKTNEYRIIPWLASQEDLIAEDWIIYVEGNAPTH